MKKYYLIGAAVGLMAISAVFLKQWVGKEKDAGEKHLVKVRIGWQVPWATQGQLSEVMQKTEILKNNGMVGDFKGFSSGAPLNEAALAGDVDVIFTADQPAATLLSKDPEWKIIGRLMYNRVGLYVPPKSAINSVADLKNKTVAMPFGAAAQRMALRVELEAGLNPQKDVKNINLGIYEQADLVKDANSTKWGNIDALAGFDPTVASFEDKGLIRLLNVENVVSVIVMSNKFIKENPDAPVKFLKAFKESYAYYKNNRQQADGWFTDGANLSITPKALEISAAVEPNLVKGNDITIGFKPDDYRILQEAADFIFDQGLVKTKVNMKDYIDLSYLNQL